MARNEFNHECKNTYVLTVRQHWKKWKKTWFKRNNSQGKWIWGQWFKKIICTKWAIDSTQPWWPCGRKADSQIFIKTCRFMNDKAIVGQKKRHMLDIINTNKQLHWKDLHLGLEPDWGNKFHRSETKLAT